MLSEGLIVNKQVNQFSIITPFVNPVGILVSCQRPFIPVTVTKPESYIITKAEIPEQHLQFGSDIIAVKKIRASPAQYMPGSFCKHGFKAHISHPAAYLI